MLSEYDIRMEIDEALKNKKWVLTGPNKNVHAEKSLERKRPDYVLMDKNNNKPLIIIEAKRPGKDLISALNQAKKYALKIGAPIAYATDGSIIKTLHIDTNKPLFLNGDEVEEFITEQIAFKYLNTNEVYTISQKIIKSRQELINVFSLANKELRKEGLQAGIERFSEFCTILFLKLYSEQEIIRENNNDKLRIDPEYRWDFFKTFSGTELIAYVNNVVIKEHFQKIYGEDIFQPLKIKNPKVLKNIINNLDELSLSDINSDIKGDAFEYFLKAYLANQHKDLGEYFTPRHIVKTLVKLINPKFGEAIYDPFCGTGGMLIESFKHIFNRMPRNEETLDFLKKNTIYGREITTNARITKMNMILTGDGHNNIQRIDSLANPIDNKYDIVITNMPFSLGNFDEYSGLYSLGSANGNFLCIEHCLRSIKPGGRMAIIIPDGILFDKKYKKIREYIYKNSYVENIVSLPQGSFKPYTEVKTSILFLKNIKEKLNQDYVWYFTVKNDGFTLNTKRKKIVTGNNDLDIFLAYNNSYEENNLMHLGFNKLIMDELKKNDFISIPNQYIEFSYNTSTNIIECKNIIEEVKEKNIEKQVKIVWSVTKNGFIKSSDNFKEQVPSEDISHYKLVPPNCFAYNPARINIGSIAINLDNDIKCVSPMYIVFKVNEKIINPRYFYWLLQSNNVKEQILHYCFGTVRQTLNYKDFCKIKIPLTDIKLQNEIVSKLDFYLESINNLKKIISSQKIYLPIKNDWSVKLIGELCNTQYGYTAKTENNSLMSKDNIRYIRTTDIINIFELDNNDIRYIGDEKLNKISEYKVNFEDILVTRSGSVGTSFYVSKKYEGMVFASYLVRLILNKNLILPKFLIYFTKTDYYWTQVELLKDVLTQPNLNAEKMKMIKIPCPSLEIQKELIYKWDEEFNLLNKFKKDINFFWEKINEILTEIW